MEKTFNRSMFANEVDFYKAKSEHFEQSLLASKTLCDIYFSIASEAIGEDAVCRIRDNTIQSLKENNDRK